MQKKQIPLTEEELKHITKLRKRPDLLERFESILEISDGEEGEIKSADEVEALLIEEVRKLGNASMGQWAKEAEARAGREHQKKNPGSYCGKKTPELVVCVREGGGGRKDLAQGPAKLPASFLRADRGRAARQEPGTQTCLERLRRGACLCAGGREGERALRF